MGNWHPDDNNCTPLVRGRRCLCHASRPYPFIWAYGLEAEPQELGDSARLSAQNEVDGIRGQLNPARRRIFSCGRAAKS